MAKPRKSLKLTPGKKTQLEAACAQLEAHVSIVAAVWPQLLPAQREAVLADSPVLNRVLAMAAPFGVGGLG